MELRGKLVWRAFDTHQLLLEAAPDAVVRRKELPYPQPITLLVRTTRRIHVTSRPTRWTMGVTDRSRAKKCTGRNFMWLAVGLEIQFDVF